MTVADKLRSRKFWLAVIGALLPIVAQALTGEIGWQEATLTSIMLLSSYVLGQSFVDGKAVEGTVPDGRAPVQHREE